MSDLTSFPDPVHVTRPLLPDLYEVEEMLESIWQSGVLTNNGKMARRLEYELGRYLNVGYLSLFSNGTAALQIACKVSGLTGEVITTPFTFAATVHSLAWCDLRPVFCDIGDSDMNIDPDRIERLVTPHTSAIMPVHVFGCPCRTDEISKIAEKYGLKVIYDAAHAFGVQVNGKSIGSFGDISMFSFHATKVYHTVEGGALTYVSQDLKERADLLRNFGIHGGGYSDEPGTNAKLNEIQAAVGLLVLKLADMEIRKRKALTLFYRDMLSVLPGLRLNCDMEGVTHNYSYFVIRVDGKEFGLSRDELCEKLKEYNIFTRKYFYPLCSQFKCYSSLPSSNPENLPAACKVAEEVLALPLYGGLKEDDVEKICRIIIHLHTVNRS